MIIQSIFVLSMGIIGIVNYILLKSFWCHEGMCDEDVQ